MVLHLGVCFIIGGTLMYKRHNRFEVQLRTQPLNTEFYLNNPIKHLVLYRKDNEIFWKIWQNLRHMFFYVKKAYRWVYFAR